ncbi:MAG TPA: BON domain-containing protein [Thermoanaerobaculia bacterium]|nr:BON domain-containing protein [Thermoanaerobaculia bacterium]
MKTKAFHLAAAIGLVLTGAAGLTVAGCGDRGAVETSRDAEGDPQLRVDGEQVEENLKETGEALRQGGEQVEQAAEQVGQALEQGAERIEREVGPVAQAVLNDAGITAKVKAKLIADPQVNPFHIDVDTLDGVVTLSGKVRSENVKAEAEKLAQITEGVKSVTNNIQVAGDAPTTSPPPAGR